jgi:hypothetical protein
MYQGNNITPPRRSDNGIVSALELRNDAIDAFKLRPEVIMFGHHVGATLGLASSFRQLLLRDKSSSRDFWLSTIFLTLSWSDETDDLFVRVIEEQMTIRGRNRAPCSARTMNDFLGRNLPALQSSASAEMQGPLLAMDFVADCGNSESIPVLKEFLTHPVLGARAAAALQRIDERGASNVK